MQEIYNNDWFARNEITSYPLDSSASLLDDTGKVTSLDTLITDISIAYPNTITGTPRISAITITEELLTTVISVGNTAILAFSDTLDDIHACEYYTFTPLLDNCYGVITFGNAVKTVRCRSCYSSAAQSGLLPNTFHCFPLFPVSGIRLHGSGTYFFGDIKLKAGTDIITAIETITPRLTRSSETVGTKKAIVFRLKSTGSENLLKKYCLESSVRPESDSCRLKSIQTISGVTPDCDGNININFEDLSYSTSGSSFIVSSGYTLGDVCPATEDKLFVGTDKCVNGEYTENTYSSKSPEQQAELYSCMAPIDNNGLCYLPSGGVTNATTGSVTTTRVSINGTAIAIQFTSAGYFTFTAGSTTFVCRDGSVKIKGKSLETTDAQLRLIVTKDKWTLLNASEVLGEWNITTDPFTEGTMSLQGSTCLRIAYQE